MDRQTENQGSRQPGRAERRGPEPGTLAAASEQPPLGAWPLGQVARGSPGLLGSSSRGNHATPGTFPSQPVFTQQVLALPASCLLYSGCLSRADRAPVSHQVPPTQEGQGWGDSRGPAEGKADVTTTSLGHSASPWPERFRQDIQGSFQALGAAHSLPRFPAPGWEAPGGGAAEWVYSTLRARQKVMYDRIPRT